MWECICGGLWTSGKFMRTRVFINCQCTSVDGGYHRDDYECTCTRSDSFRVVSYLQGWKRKGGNVQVWNDTKGK